MAAILAFPHFMKGLITSMKFCQVCRVGVGHKVRETYRSQVPEKWCRWRRKSQTPPSSSSLSLIEPLTSVTSLSISSLTPRGQSRADRCEK